MKKILITLTAVVMLSGVAAAVDFQKVYELPKMTATQIQQAYGDPVIDVGQDGIAKFQSIMNVSQGTGWMNGLNNSKTGKLRCNISVTSWLPAVNNWADAEVIFQIKDGRARVTVDQLAVHGPGKTTCLASIEQYLDRKFSTLKALDNNW